VRTTVSERWFPKRDPRSGGSIYIFVLGANRTPHAVARELGHREALALLVERSPPGLRLALACELGDESAIADLLKSHPGLAQTLGDEDRRRLVDAAQENDATAIRLMLAAGWPLDARGQHGATALHWAAFHGNAAMAREILRHRPPLAARDADYDQTPVGWARHGADHSWHRASGDYEATLAALLEGGVSP
jgi:ankyrin repeat protein